MSKNDDWKKDLLIIIGFIVAFLLFIIFPEWFVGIILIIILFILFR